MLPRLHRLSPQARAVAAAVAVLGPGTALRYVAALSRLDVAAASDGCDELVAAEILAPGRPLAFAHPLFDQAVDALMSDAERHHAHRHAAQVLADEAAAPETVGAHLLLVEPLADRWVVERLVAAADHASRKGAARTAATYLDRAVQEPPAPDERAAVLAALGRAQLFLGGSTGLTTLRAALELAGGPRPREQLRFTGVGRSSKRRLPASTARRHFARTDTGEHRARGRGRRAAV